MDLQMNGKTALVTGGSVGIGKAIAFALAREGVDVAICARRKQPLEAAASQIARETNRKIVAIPADLTKPADAEAFVKDAHTALGRIDILVNNAGSAPGGVLDFLTEEHWAQSLQLKFMGYVRCLKHVLPIMQKQGRGRVVNLIGNDGVKPSYWEIAPGAANAAGQNLTLALAAQYARDNISFVAVNPGPVRTERWGALLMRCRETWKSRARRLICSPRAAFHWGVLPNARRSPVSSLTSPPIWRTSLMAQ